jgi:hypothetical protein
MRMILKAKYTSVSSLGNFQLTLFILPNNLHADLGAERGKYAVFG